MRVKETMSRIRSAIDGAYAASVCFVEDAFETSVSCRECGQRVKFFDRYCPTCGQFAPARLSLKGGLILFGFPIILLSIYLVQKHAL